MVSQKQITANMDATKISSSSVADEPISTPPAKAPVDVRDDNTHDGSSFGSIDMQPKEGSLSHCTPAKKVRSRASNIYASVKKSATSTPTRSVASSMHYSSPRASFLQTALNGIGNKTSVTKSSPTKGGVQGTFMGCQSNYLQQSLKKDAPATMTA